MFLPSNQPQQKFSKIDDYNDNVIPQKLKKI